MSGAMLAMPLLVMNMGGEMVYILEQRLRAQSIPKDKSTKVLTDVVKTMYSSKFIAELFKPQAVYTNQNTRQIFDRLAHSSIMRLNESSMDKLYDLMTMGFKYQVLCCRSPQDVVQVTLNHLEIIREIVEDPSVDVLLEGAINATVDKYMKLSAADFMLLHQTLLGFFKDRRIKVSIFLQDGIQNMDGSIVLSMEGPVTNGSNPPGTITYYSSAGKSGSKKVPIMNSKLSSSETPCKDIWDRKLRTTQLGFNMYAKDRTSSPSVPLTNSTAAGTSSGGSASAKGDEPDKMPHESAGAPKSDGGSSSPKGDEAPSKSSASSSAAARAELNLLADLLGRAADTSAEESKPIKLTLFAEDPFTGFGSNSSGYIQTQNLSFDASKNTKKNAAEIMSKLGMNEGTPSGGESKGKSEEESLLDLMDEAASK